MAAAAAQRALEVLAEEDPAVAAEAGALHQDTTQDGQPSPDRSAAPGLPLTCLLAPMHHAMHWTHHLGQSSLAALFLCRLHMVMHPLPNLVPAADIHTLLHSESLTAGLLLVSRRLLVLSTLVAYLHP